MRRSNHLNRNWFDRTLAAGQTTHRSSHLLATVVATVGLTARISSVRPSGFREKHTKNVLEDR